MLDDDFGVVEPAARRVGIGLRPAVEPWELQTPFSLTELTPTTAGPLRVRMQNLEQGYSIGTLLTNQTRILWVVTDDGRLLLAVEELTQNSRPTGHPYCRQHPYFGNWPKLGHPSLVNGVPARIAGELYFDANGSPTQPRWYISNNSGRYSWQPSRRRTHLENVRDVFASYQIPLTIDWI